MHFTKSARLGVSTACYRICYQSSKIRIHWLLTILFEYQANAEGHDWEDPRSSEYPGVRVYAQKMKQTLISAHDSIIQARVKQTKDANKRRRACPLSQGDMVYISTKNLNFPKGLARKLLPKFVGPYRITKDFGNNSFKVDLPDCMKQRGIHDVFHSSHLRIYVPSDDRLFPGRLDNQVAEFEDQECEWAVDKIMSHKGSKSDALFEVRWKSGDPTWLPVTDGQRCDRSSPFLSRLSLLPASLSNNHMPRCYFTLTVRT